MDRLEGVLAQCGVNRDNVFGNIYMYSMFVSQNLDFLASAAGKVDVEASRYIRMAQQMVRTRVDVLFRASFFGDEPFGARGNFRPFGGIDIATSEDAGQAFKADPDSILDDLDKFFNGATQYGDFMRMEGRLFENLRWILKAEDAFCRAEIKDIVSADTENNSVWRLQQAAATVCSFLYKAIALLRDKLICQTGSRGRLVCTGCGSLFSLIDTDERGNMAGCDVCGAPASLIVSFPCATSPAIDEIYRSMDV